VDPGAARSQFQLAWSAPAGCPDREAAIARIDRSLGGHLAGHPTELDVSVTVAQALSHDWSVRIEAASATGRRVRELNGRSCRAVVAAATLIIALMIDPNAQPEPEPELETTEAPPPPPREPSVPTFTPPLQAGPPSSTSGIDVAIVSGMAAGVVPKLAPSAGLRSSLTRGHLRLELDAKGLFPSQTTLPALPGTGGKVDLLAAGFSGCYSLPAGSWQIAACLGTELGRLHAVGFGVSDPGQGSALWAAASAALALSRSLGKRWMVEGRSSALVPWVRPRFVLTNVGDVFQPSRVGGLFTFAMGYKW
jgi:hypothetical protein